MGTNRVWSAEDLVTQWATAQKGMSATGRMLVVDYPLVGCCATLLGLLDAQFIIQLVDRPVV